ncbi:tripartite tricarboxylate transporter substrate binding protein [Paeniroseomonas aquatica]|uniref:tripartite tricarboxylate transporter substrate binding protein n=1 Tax=Paeniroseomonas aquatica TaxID=373043 RepID=UPI003615D0C7
MPYHAPREQCRPPGDATPRDHRHAPTQPACRRGHRPLAAPLAAARAEERFPGRPLRLVIPVGVAGATDIVGRILAEQMGTLLGRPVVAENIAGAGSTIGAAAFLRAPADGYTLYLGTNNHPIMQAVRPESRTTRCGTSSRSPWSRGSRACWRCIPRCRRRMSPRCSPGCAGSGMRRIRLHLPRRDQPPGGGAAEEPRRAGDTIVPYRTAANAVQDLVAGRVQLTIDSPMMLAPLIREGRLRGLAVTGAERTDLLPGLPTLAEAGVPGYELTAWQVLFVKPGTAPEVVAVLAEAARRAVADPGVQQKLRQNSAEVWPDASPAAAAALVRSETERWGGIVRRIGLTAQ